MKMLLGLAVLVVMLNVLHSAPEDQPRVMSEDQPRVMSEDQPRVMSEDQPRVMSEDQPRVMSEDQPRVMSEDQPRVMSEDQPRVMSEDQPRVMSEDQPRVMSEDQPRVMSEDQPRVMSEDTLKQLSLDGEKLVDEEMKRALYGVKQMKEVMWRNEQKHEHLMKSLRHSSDKKKGAAQLAQDVTEKLEEAEELCKDSLQSEWEACRPCLEDACKTFYISTCRRGFATFRAKVQNFFHRVSKRFGPREPPMDTGDIIVNQSPEADMEVVRMEDTFNRLMSKVGALVDRSILLVSKMRSRLDNVLQRAFLDKTDSLEEQPTSDPFYPARDSGFLQGVGLEEVMDSFFDFGKSVVEEFGAVVTQVFDDLHVAVEDEGKKAKESFPRFLKNRKLCRDLRRQTSECWQLQNQCAPCQGALLTECPSVRELHVELDEVSQLLDVSKQQYEEILSIVQRHTDETVSWLGNMADEFSWVAEVVSNNSTPENIFHITMVVPKSSDVDNASVTETKVEVYILNSPPFIISVPGELELQEPAFIQYVALEALGRYKERIRRDDDKTTEESY